jgi:hypothetical protein
MTDLATRVTETAARLLERRLGRRSFISRATLAGSAMTVAPVGYLLRPVSAYAAICGCANQDCDCGQACCDGYTEFCCTLTGENACPPGSVMAGWWKADGSGLCGPGAPRYYMDCNAPAGGPCGPRGVTAVATNCGCRCGGGNCNNRVECCNAFRYGQCHQEIPCLGPIVCRVVTCSPPWQLDSTCSTTVATDNFTASHDAPCLHPPPPPPPPPPTAGSLPVMFSGGRWYLARDRVSNPAPTLLNYGFSGDAAFAGDWDGNGAYGPGVLRGTTWYLRQEMNCCDPDIVFEFGEPGDQPVVGDWTGQGISRVGVVRGGEWHLRNTFTSGPPDTSFYYGGPDDIPFAGDWNGDGIFTPAVFRDGHWYLRHSNTTGEPDLDFEFGLPGDVPVVGDWNGDGVWGVGVIRGTVWYLRNTLTAGPPEGEFSFDVPDLDEGMVQFRVWALRARA